VLSVYGFTEARICFPECPAPVPSGFHIFPDLCIVETIDPETGDPVAEGEKGEIVYTAIDGRGSVVLRYRTGDIAEGGLVHEPCPHCGRLTPRILGPMSRASSVVDYRLSKIKGTLVNLDYLGRVIADQTGVEEWQLVIGKKNNDPLDVDELVLHLALSEGENEAAVRTELENRLRSELEVGVNRFYFHPLAEMLTRIGMETRLKEERVVDRRNELEEKLLEAEDKEDMAPRPS
jgi:phenylacetate-coenzyme A ligase PaaK-like adenylate-forming protein